MRRMAIAGALLVMTVAATAQVQPGPVYEVSERDDGRSLRVPLGSEIRARLPQQAGTAYRWEMRNDPHLTLIAPVTTRDFAPNGVVGGRQLREFRIRVARPGRFPLIFGLRAATDDDNQPPAQRVTLTIETLVTTRPQPFQPRPWTGDDTTDGPDTVEPLTAADERRTIDLPVGQEQTIALESNTSTGYYWQMVSSGNVTLLGPVQEERARQPRGMVGGGGNTLVRFRVNKPGKAFLTMIYYRPGGQLPEKILNYYFRGI